MNCSRPILTAKCGQMAYDLYEELVWKIITAATQSFASLGLDSVWPQECMAFSAAYDNHGVTGIPTSGTTTEETEKSSGSSSESNVPESEVATTPISKCQNATCDNTYVLVIILFVLFISK